MTVNPQTLVDLGRYWVAHDGVNLGVVGDVAHQARPSYHNGQNVIDANGWTAANDYSIRHERDREPHLTNAASAIDLGKLRGTLKGLQDFSRWLVAQAQSQAAGTGQIREIIYSPDGSNVQRYSGIDGRIHTGPGNGDLSHRTHTHISFFRDTERRDKRPIFAPYFAPQVPDTDTEDDVNPDVITVLPFGGRYTIPANTKVTAYPVAADGSIDLKATPKVWEPRATPSSADYDALLVTDTTKGDPFLRGTNGFFDEHWISSGLVQEVPNGPPAVSCDDKVAAENERKRAEMHAAVDEVYG